MSARSRQEPVFPTACAPATPLRTGSHPIGVTMMLMALVAAAVNLASLFLLKRLRGKDVSLRAATTFSLNDFIPNGGIFVLWTGLNWPDLVVGVGVAGMAMYGGIDILRDASREAASAEED